MDQVGGNGAVDDAQHLTHGLGVGGEEVTQGEGDAEDPLAQWDSGKDLIGQQGGGLGHAPGAAAGAKSALFAGEGHEALEVAGVAPHPEKAVLQAPAFEVGFELLVDMIRQGFALAGQVLDKVGVMGLDKPVEQRLPGLVALVGDIVRAVPGCQHAGASDTGGGATSVWQSWRVCHVRSGQERGRDSSGLGSRLTWSNTAGHSK